MKKATTIAVDIAQAVLEIAVSHRPNQVAARYRLQRSEFPTFYTTGRHSNGRASSPRARRGLRGEIDDDESVETDAGRSR